MDFALRVRSEPRLLSAVRALVRGYAQAQGCASERAEEVVLAIDEACTNAIRHAYGGRPDEWLELSGVREASVLEFTLVDQGRPAPAGKVARRDAPVRRRSVRPGGLGVQLIHRVFDEVEFAPGETRGNRVVMRLRVADPPGEGAHGPED